MTKARAKTGKARVRRRRRARARRSDYRPLVGEIVYYGRRVEPAGMSDYGVDGEGL